MLTELSHGWLTQSTRRIIETIGSMTLTINVIIFHIFPLKNEHSTETRTSCHRKLHEAREASELAAPTPALASAHMLKRAARKELSTGNTKVKLG
jgi:hypothetical protein